MNNYKFSLAIEAEDIYDKLLPEQKEKINKIKITNVQLHQDKRVYIECLALDQDIEELPFTQKLIGDWSIRAF